MAKVFLRENVLDAARERIRFVFDHFEMIVVSFSGGKDSTVLLELARQEAALRGRKIHALLIDLEAQYALTMEHVERCIVNVPEVIPVWVCLPLNLRNAVSVFSPHWCCWDPEAKGKWVRPMPEYDEVISDPSALPFFRHRMEFEEFVAKIPGWLGQGKTYASLVGIRADESLNRYKSVSRQDKKSAWVVDGKRIPWATIASDGAVALFPIYDWRLGDVWKFHYDAGISHNKVYDRMHLCGVPFSEQRICQPYGDDQRKGLDTWAKIEPETWPAVLARVGGVNYGARYAGQKLLGYHRGEGLPSGHNWRSYTFFLLSTLPDVMRERYLSNFAVFLEWWQRHGYPDLSGVHDDETSYTTKEIRQLPSWRRLCLAVLKNDFLCKSLSIGQVKNVFADVYERVAVGQPVKVRKSVTPVYDFLRDQYDLYIAGGISAVRMDFCQGKNARSLALEEKIKCL
jgi:predicted phosphoadenosine phosphosulfate sulfurtransferase